MPPGWTKSRTKWRKGAATKNKGAIAAEATKMRTKGLVNTVIVAEDCVVDVGVRTKGSNGTQPHTLHRTEENEVRGREMIPAPSVIALHLKTCMAVAW